LVDRLAVGIEGVRKKFEVCAKCALRFEPVTTVQEEVVTVDALLVATGRSPNVADMGLDKAGVQFDEHKGILVNDYLQSSSRNIYAVGDCCTRYQFTHVADFMARMVVRNALFFGSGGMPGCFKPASEDFLCTLQTWRQRAQPVTRNFKF
jgi:pyruvate/2-oxoglutarate dehydrogenase complex dihydrolipoamide dehydrogenase (E3) component